MANNCGVIGFATGTGVKEFNIGMTPTWATVEFRGSGIKPSKGYMYGGDQYCFPDDTTSPAVNKAILVKDTSGTTLVEGTWTSFPSGKIRFTLTTNSLTNPQALITFGN